MNKFLISGAIVGALFVYFFMVLVIFPEEYLSHKVIEPQPTHMITVSQNEIRLSDSFIIKIEVENKNDPADILITSTTFPKLEEIEYVEIIEYDYTQSSKHIEVGNMIGSEYTLGESINAKYPSIEASSRNVPENGTHKMSLKITPQNTGVFVTHIKTIAIPHTTDLSHYPNEGFLDFQREYVSVIEITVKS